MRELPDGILCRRWRSQGALQAVERTASGMDCLLHALVNMGPMPAELRQSWASLFNHYVFRADERDLEHIPEQRRGVLGRLSPEAARRIRDLLIARLKG